MKVGTYLSGRLKEEFERYRDEKKQSAKPPAKVTDGKVVRHLIKRGLESEKRGRER